jgi:hypothetical protein
MYRFSTIRQERRGLECIAAIQIVAFSRILYCFETTRADGFAGSGNGGNRPRLEALSARMLACLKVELVSLFIWVQRSIIESARDDRGRFFPWIAPVFLVAILGAVLGHVAAMVQTGRAGSDS